MNADRAIAVFKCEEENRAYKKIAVLGSYAYAQDYEGRLLPVEKVLYMAYLVSFLAPLYASLWI